MSPRERLARAEAASCWIVATFLWLCAPMHQHAPHVQGSIEGPSGSPAGSPMLLGHRTALHRADRADLEALPGLGPVLAGRILEARGAGACWSRLDALEEVQGIGPSTIEDLRDYAYAGCVP